MRNLYLNVISDQSSGFRRARGRFLVSSNPRKSPDALACILESFQEGVEQCLLKHSKRNEFGYSNAADSARVGMSIHDVYPLKFSGAQITPA
jgi:hypothetical protein